MSIRVGIIGGSGLDNPDFFSSTAEVEPETRFGKPSSSLKTGTIGDVEIALLARHGREHTIPPAEVNYRANIAALQSIGCTHILATTAVGSLREEIGRGDLVVLDQFIDFTKRRINTFYERFEPGNPVHAAMADPFSEELRNLLIDGCVRRGYKVHERGTVVTIEGPRFSTRAESHMFRSWGADVINMTIATEASPANEAGIPYAAIAMSTDYDCWKEDEKPVSWDEIVKVFSSNAERVTNLLLDCIPRIGT